ncbi:MAG: hypothetical protein JSW26_02900, partial [Desulfobacterales bacterium]
IDVDQLYPASGTLVNNNRPVITTGYSDEYSLIDPVSVQLLLDGVDVTGQATVNQDDIAYTPPNPLSDGSHTLTIYIADQWGYAADPFSWSFTVDATAPMVTITSPSDGDYLYPAIQTVRWTIDGENPASLILTVNGGSETLGPTATETTVELEAGMNTIELSALDQAGNSTTAAIQITLDDDRDGDGIGDHYDPDNDNDLMPDSWEAVNGFDPFDPFDARLDSDGDGHANLTEYSAGTDPQDSASYPAVTLAVDHVMVTDVTSDGFSVIWQASEPSTCSLEVYDETGALLSNLAKVSESRLYPPAEDIGVMKVTVNGLEADRTYYFQTLTISKASGQVLYTPVYPQVFEVITESADAAVVNDLIKQKIFDENGYAADGALLVASVTGGDYPVTAWVGQDMASPWARVDLNRIYSEVTHENLQLLGDEELTLWSFGGQLGNYVNIQKSAQPTGVEQMALPDAAYLSRESGFTFDLNMDLNFVCLPVYTETSFSAHSLLIYLEEQAAGDSDVVESIKRYNQQTGNWEMASWFMGMPAGPDFPIKPGEAYYIYLQEDVNNVWFEGIALGVSIDLLPGMNPVCLPAAGDGFVYNSYQMLEDLGDEDQVSYIERFNPDEGWQSTSWFLGSPAGDEYMTRTSEGYIIYMNQEKLDWRPY